MVSKLEKCKLYIFDLEGTLINIPVDWEEVDRRIEVLIGTDPHPYQKKISVLPIKIKKKIFEIVDHWEKKAFKDASININGIEYLKKVSIDNSIVIATLSGRKITDLSLKKLGIKDRISLVVTRNEKYPRNEQLKYILDIYQIDPSNIIFVGDRDIDEEAAYDIKCTFKNINKVHQ